MEIINPFDLCLKVNHIWEKQWLLLSSGDFEKNDFNSMTVGWGAFGIMWGKPIAMVVVRPTRYTYDFMNKYDNFSLTAFDEAYKEDLNLLGSISGRDGDKISKTDLTPIKADMISSPVFKESELMIECKKIYYDDLKPENILFDDFEKFYPLKDYHRIYFGEILSVKGKKDFVK